MKRTGEDELVAWLRRRTERGGAGLIGDDAALLPEREEWAVTMDSQIEGVHFRPGTDAATLARRLVVVNLSDLAATGARPAYAFLALAVPAGFEHRRFLDALVRALRRHGAELAGGDLASSPTTTAVLTLLGRKAPGGRWLRRGGARRGERLWLGGNVGDSAAGAVLVASGAALEGRTVRLPEGFAAAAALAAAARRAVRRHLAPRPQLDLGRWLARRGSGGAIDVSDGVARDLHRMCSESGVGAEVELEAIPTGRHFRRLAAAIGRDWRELALGGGEDYVLLFTLPAEIEPPQRFGCRPIGRVVAGRRIHLLDHGKRTALPPLGWDHLRP